MKSLPRRTSRVSTRRKQTLTTAELSSSSSSSSSSDQDADFVLSTGRQRPKATTLRALSSQSRSTVDSPVKKRRRVSRTKQEPELPSLLETLADDKQALQISSKSPSSFSELELKSFRENLLSWYVANHRSFPWRTAPRYRREEPPLPPDVPLTPSSPGAPYAIWVSEVMSQQTRIEVVVEYYNRWMSNFPTVRCLADSSLDRVNELWAGLGYYRRARFLHEGAKTVVDKFDGILPNDLCALRDIKGIGRYTAGAIASIAFGKSVPCVDGNVDRVYSRLRPGVNRPEGRDDAVWQIAGDCVQDVECAGDFNQALMELGATVCKPRAVRCDICPVRDVCGAYKEALDCGVQDPATYVMRYPIKSAKKGVKVRNEAVIVLVVCARVDGELKFLVVQRGADKLLGGLWEALNVVCGNTMKEGKQGEQFVNSLVGELKDVLGCKHDLMNEDIIGPLADGGSLVHVFSHIRQTLNVKVVVLANEYCDDEVIVDDGTTLNGKRFRWMCSKGLENAAVSTQMRKVFARAVQHVPSS